MYVRLWSQRVSCGTQFWQAQHVGNLWQRPLWRASITCSATLWHVYSWIYLLKNIVASITPDLSTFLFGVLLHECSLHITNATFHSLQRRGFTRNCSTGLNWSLIYSKNHEHDEYAWTSIRSVGWSNLWWLLLLRWLLICILEGTVATLQVPGILEPLNIQLSSLCEPLSLSHHS